MHQWHLCLPPYHSKNALPNWTSILQQFSYLFRPTQYDFTNSNRRPHHCARTKHRAPHSTSSCVHQVGSLGQGSPPRLSLSLRLAQRTCAPCTQWWGVKKLRQGVPLAVKMFHMLTYTTTVVSTRCHAPYYNVYARSDRSSRCGRMGQNRRWPCIVPRLHCSDARRCVSLRHPHRGSLSSSSSFKNRLTAIMSES
jgi:hypothetical protein